MPTESKHTPGALIVQFRGDIGEYHTITETGEIIGRFARRSDAAQHAAAPDLLGWAKDATELIDLLSPNEYAEEIECRWCGRVYEELETESDGNDDSRYMCTSEDCPGFKLRAIIAKAEKGA